MQDHNPDHEARHPSKESLPPHEDLRYIAYNKLLPRLHKSLPRMAPTDDTITAVGNEMERHVHWLSEIACDRTLDDRTSFRLQRLALHILRQVEIDVKIFTARFPSIAPEIATLEGLGTTEQPTQASLIVQRANRLLADSDKQSLAKLIAIQLLTILDLAWHHAHAIEKCITYRSKLKDLSAPLSEDKYQYTNYAHERKESLHHLNESLNAFADILQVSMPYKNEGQIQKLCSDVYVLNLPEFESDTIDTFLLEATKYDAAGLFMKLKACANPISSYIWDQLPIALQKALFGLDVTSFNWRLELESECSDSINWTRGDSPFDRVNALTNGINNVLQSRVPLSANNRFIGIKLSPRLQKLIAAKPDALGLVELNRLLLQAAFPQEIPAYTTTLQSWFNASKDILLQFAGEHPEENPTLRKSLVYVDPLSARYKKLIPQQRIKRISADARGQIYGQIKQAMKHLIGKWQENDATLLG